MRDASAERALWLAVLQQQIEDALIGVPTTTAKPHLRELLIEDARRFLTRPSEDLSALCTLGGLDPDWLVHAMRQRIAQAPTPAELVAQGLVASRPAKKEAPKAKRVPFRHRLFTIAGTTRTAEEWSRHTGVSLGAMQHRLKSGWPMEQALTMPSDEAQRRQRQKSHQRLTVGLRHAHATGRTWKRGSPERLLTHEGETLPVSAWAARTGISAATIKSRLRLGMSIADALTPGRAPRRTQPQAPAAEGEGAGRDFARNGGTGGPTSVQDRTKMDFQTELEDA